MLNEREYYIVEVFSSDKDDLGAISDLAIKEYFCEGIEEYNYDEATVDEVLDERAYCWANIENELIDKMDEYNQGNVFKYTFFFSDTNAKERSKKFEDKIKEKFITIKTAWLAIPYEDWDKKWRQSYAPIKVTDNITIVPSWLKSDFPNGIYIYPGQGFGTGTHETTSLCLKIFDETKDDFKSKIDCLDLGCGSGILGIAVLKSIQSNVIFCDVDKGALDNTLQNLQLNFPTRDLTGSSLVLRNRLPSNKKYQLIFANILVNILIDEASFIIESLENGGRLILSGILINQAEEVKAAYSKLKLLGEKEKNGWMAMLMEK